MKTEKSQKFDTDEKVVSEQHDVFSDLLVFDRLEIGPVRLEHSRLIAPYRLSWGEKSESTELIYRYEQPVFDPDSAESRNLADMIAAQVALNYGLFCRTLVFNGNYDRLDRKFIRAMAENTAREIYVKKFLEPNPFLVGKFASAAAVKKPKYLQAQIVFARSTDKAPASWRFWETHKERHCILSSGGKDSLLSYGLLNEIGTETYPIFLNESGRHWFTAVNAYRHFKDTVPQTGRVWVNSDRVFSWMLQRMPFIRKDFANVRADGYPIRLWTVAVFLFGVLPLLKKHKIGRLLIGDEYDTSVRKRYHGITHYDGLYDQSIYFDHAMSSYFMRKGWAVRQFSVLRPLSELLIEKILSARYPELLVHQVSCHMTHKEAERMLPCGKCEKCRRIVCMLMALDKDPRQCGYTDKQVETCLKEFQAKGIQQEAAGVRQITRMLDQKGLIQRAGSHHLTTGQGQVLKLRFDPRVSPTNAIPEDLRRPIWSVFLEHAQGALIRSGSSWRDFDPLSASAISQSYPFEVDIQSKISPRADEKDDKQTPNYIWGELTWPEAEKYLRKTDIALLPVGAIEQHGPHLPLDTDTFDAEYLARRVAAACSNPKPLVLNVIPYGVSYHHDDFKGTLSVSNDTLSRLVYDLGMGLARNGIRKLVIINGHGGNTPALSYAAQMIHRDTGIFVCVDTGETSDVDLNEIIETPNDVHAGEMETSTALAVRPHLVKMSQAAASVPSFSSRYLDFTSKRGVSWYAFTNQLSKNGVMGNPVKADARKGVQLWDMMIAHLVGLVEDLKPMSLDEIHRSKADE